MNGYKDLSKQVVFSFEDALQIFEHKSTTYSSLATLRRKGLLKKIRNNLYSCVNPVTGTTFANKYQIGSNINDNCHISHTSALEYYGYQSQVRNILYVASKKRFNAFEFEGVTYKYVPSHTPEGVIEPPYTYKIKITDIEKTMIDTLHSIDSLINLDELVHSFRLIPSVNQEKLLHYLSRHDIQALYQRTAYILSLMKDDMGLDHSFFKNVRSKIGKGVAYLDADAKSDGVFINEYNLIVPKWIHERSQEHAL
jgi:predicted transcriptional regulator of viral defense system